MDEMFDILTYGEQTTDDMDDNLTCSGKIEACDKTACRKFEVFVPITVTPFGTPHDIDVECFGDVKVQDGDKCNGRGPGTHKFTISQVIKVFIPVKFGADVCFAESCDTDLGKCDEEHEPTSITLCHSTLRIDRGRTHQFTATVLPEDARDKSVTWTSDNETFVTISANGLATGIRRGTTTITGTTVNGISAHCTVEVRDED